jgi:drug/metabolite transporter (DMT)-like permease
VILENIGMARRERKQYWHMSLARRALCAKQSTINSRLLRRKEHPPRNEMEKKGKMKSKIWLALIALYLVWGSTYFGIKVAIETIPPFFHAGVRFLISGIILVAWQRAAGQQMPTRKQWISTAIIGSLLLLGGNGLVSWAEQFIPSGIAALIIASVPLFLVAAEAIRPNGVKPNWQSIVGLLIGFVGIYVLINPAEASTGTGLNIYGVAALLSACLLWATGSVYSKSADLPKSALMSTGAQMLME